MSSGLTMTNEGGARPGRTNAFTSKYTPGTKGEAWGRRLPTDYELESGKRIDQYGVTQAAKQGFQKGAVQGLTMAAPLALAGPVGWAVIGAAALAGGFMGKGKAIKAKKSADIEGAKQRDLAAVSGEAQAAVQQREQRAQSDAKTRAGKAPKKKKTDDQVLASGMAQPAATASSGRTKSDQWHSGTFGS